MRFTTASPTSTFGITTTTLTLLLLLILTLLPTATAGPNPLTHPIDLSDLTTPLDTFLQDKIDASVRCHITGKCRAVLAAHIKCITAGNTSAIAECSCKELQEAGARTRECMQCQADAGQVELSGMVEEFDGQCRRFGVTFAQISEGRGRNGGGLGRGQWVGIVAGIVAAGGMAL